MLHLHPQLPSTPSTSRVGIEQRHSKLEFTSIPFYTLFDRSKTTKPYLWLTIALLTLIVDVCIAQFVCIQLENNLKSTKMNMIIKRAIAIL